MPVVANSRPKEKTWRERPTTVRNARNATARRRPRRQRRRWRKRPKPNELPRRKAPSGSRKPNSQSGSGSGGDRHACLAGNGEKGATRRHDRLVAGDRVVAGLESLPVLGASLAGPIVEQKVRSVLSGSQRLFLNRRAELYG